MPIVESKINFARSTIKTEKIFTLKSYDRKWRLDTITT
jgi:hypothetical protein